MGMKKFLLSYFFFLVFLLLFFASGAIDSQDGFLYTAVARNIYYKGEPTAPFYDWGKKERENKNIPLNVYTGKDGKIYTRTGLGYSLALVPAVSITDIFYKYYNVTPQANFPLESDWLLPILVSFTNSLLGAGMTLVIFLYFYTFLHTKRKALFMSLVTLFTTNLLAITLSSFAHVMFISFIVLSFLLVRLYSLYGKKNLLFFTGITLGIAMLSYNMTFILIVPALILYYFLLVGNKKNINDFFLVIVGMLPFIFIFSGYEFVRQEANMPFGGRDLRDTFYSFNNLPIKNVIEGLYGQILSPGRSIFLYSPLLLIPLFFWHKIKNRIFPELLVFILLSIIYVIFYAFQYQIIKPEYGITGFWHGESSWGPRYLAILIPFGMLLTAFIYQSLSRKTKLFIFLPFALFGLYIELLGVIMPYQIKYRGLDPSIVVNNSYYPVGIYSNLLPQYSPILTMSKKLIKSIRDFPKTLDHGVYNTRLYDGIDFAFNVGQERWRVIDGKGFISFDNLKKDPVKKISFGLINHPLIESSSSAKLQFTLNDHPLLEKSAVFEARERNIIEIPINSSFLKEKANQLQLDVTFNPPIKDSAQIFAIIAFSINNHPVNLESLDFPYYSPLGHAMTGAYYQNYGKIITDPWRLWDLHTQVYEATPNLWWVKPLFYWDLPQKMFLILLVADSIGITCFGYLVFKKYYT